MFTSLAFFWQVSSSGVYLDKDGMSSIADDELCSAREKEGDVVIITGKLNYHDTETSFRILSPKLP